MLRLSAKRVDATGHLVHQSGSRMKKIWSKKRFQVSLLGLIVGEIIIIFLSFGMSCHTPIMEHKRVY